MQLTGVLEIYFAMGSSAKAKAALSAAFSTYSSNNLQRGNQKVNEYSLHVSGSTFICSGLCLVSAGVRGASDAGRWKYRKLG
jgi:ketosteroid isomerase-like protein